MTTESELLEYEQKKTSPVYQTKLVKQKYLIGGL